jgi:hypothetical protein
LPLACLPNLRELNKPANKKARQLNKVTGLKINVQMKVLNHFAHQWVAKAMFTTFHPAGISFFESVRPGYFYAEIIPAMAFGKVKN